MVSKSTHVSFERFVVDKQMNKFFKVLNNSPKLYLRKIRNFSNKIMVEHNLDNNMICRLCLFKCENPRNMLADKDFGKKVMEVFPKILVK